MWIIALPQELQLVNHVQCALTHNICSLKTNKQGNNYSIYQYILVKYSITSNAQITSTTTSGKSCKLTLSRITIGVKHMEGPHMVCVAAEQRKWVRYID